jgi:hypothetical protein
MADCIKYLAHTIIQQALYTHYLFQPSELPHKLGALISLIFK